MGEFPPNPSSSSSLNAFNPNVRSLTPLHPRATGADAGGTDVSATGSTAPEHGAGAEAEGEGS